MVEDAELHPLDRLSAKLQGFAKFEVMPLEEKGISGNSGDGRSDEHQRWEGGKTIKPSFDPRPSI